MHELVADTDISKAIFSLKDIQKELLYQLAIRGYSCQLIVAFRGQTGRNIRKTRDTMLKKIRKEFVANRPNSVFCGAKCKNRYNVYKSRAKDKE